MSFKFVRRRVFDGGVGWTRGGREERSRESDLLEPVERLEKMGRLSNLGDSILVVVRRECVVGCGCVWLRLRRDSEVLLVRVLLCRRCGALVHVQAGV